MSLFGLPFDLTNVSEQGFALAERAVEALETMASALTRQAAVMESDVADEQPAAFEAVWVRRYGETLSRVLDSEDLNLFEKNKNLRNLASTMTKHGEDKRAQG